MPGDLQRYTEGQEPEKGDLRKQEGLLKGEDGGWGGLGLGSRRKALVSAASWRPGLTASLADFTDHLRTSSEVEGKATNGNEAKHELADLVKVDSCKVTPGDRAVIQKIDLESGGNKKRCHSLPVRSTSRPESNVVSIMYHLAG